MFTRKRKKKETSILKIYHKDRHFDEPWGFLVTFLSVSIPPVPYHFTLFHSVCD